MQEFKDSKDAFFIPRYLNPAEEKDCTVLTNALKASFAAGKKMVIAQVGTSDHAVALGIMVNGQFKIIDSTYQTVVDIEALTKVINQANIKNNQGKTIAFEGEYVRTSLQRGLECYRFSMLYCYQLAKKLDLEAYQEVNGAFLDGRLKTYEDHKNIGGSRRVKDLINIKTHAYDYRPFMDSWALRICGFKVNKWQEIALKDINENHGQLAVYTLKKGTFPKILRFNKDAKELFLENEHGITVPLLDEATLLGDPQEDLTKTFGSLLPAHEGVTCYLFFKKGNPTPTLFHPAAGQQLYVKFPSGLRRNLPYT